MAFTPEQMAKLIDASVIDVGLSDFKVLNEQHDSLLALVTSVITVSKNLAARALLAETKVDELRAWQAKAFLAHPNIDLDIESVDKQEAAELELVKNTTVDPNE